MRYRDERAIRSLQNEVGLGGRPDAAPARSQTTVLAVDFDLMARNTASRTTTTLGESLREKGWNELRPISPQFSGNYTCRGARDMLCSMVRAIEEMNDIQKSTLTVNVHVSMQSVVVDNIVWPFSDVGCGVTLRLEAQQKLKATYVEPIIEIARMTTRAAKHQHQSRPKVCCRRKRRSKEGGEQPHGKASNGCLCWLLNYEFVDASSYMDLPFGPRWHVS